MEAPKFPDVVLVVEGERFPAHRGVLAARSEYFRGMLEGSRQQEITLEVSARAFWAGEEDDKGAVCTALELEVLKAADLFQAEGLLKHCLEGFRSGLSVHTVVEQLVGAQGRAGGGADRHDRVLLYPFERHPGVLLWSRLLY